MASSVPTPSSTSVAAHLSALVSAVVGVIALLHPGFQEPAVVQSLVTAAALVISGALEVVHLVSTNQTIRALAPSPVSESTKK